MPTNLSDSWNVPGVGGRSSNTRTEISTCRSRLGDELFLNERWPSALAWMITGRYPIEAFREAIDGGGIKNVIAIWTESPTGG
jgi:hypothetical protein